MEAWWNDRNFYNISHARYAAFYEVKDINQNIHSIYRESRKKIKIFNIKQIFSRN